MVLKVFSGLGPEKLKDLLKVWDVDCTSLANETSTIKGELVILYCSCECKSLVSMSCAHVTFLKVMEHARM